VKQLVEACLGTYGAVDIIVNNAYSGSSAARVEPLDDACFEHQLRINFFAAKWAMAEAFGTCGCGTGGGS
jgi:NAD(P)-dependent dehydrogenase (short-subunit alcohol dehydrogenase family)